jgi:hypothetical protein
MIDWEQIAGKLYTSLNAMPCRCLRGGWTKQPDGTTDRPIVFLCSRCLALKTYNEAIAHA